MSDLISRQDAIDAIVNTPTDVYSHDRIISVLDGAAFRQNEIIDIINALPSAEHHKLNVAEYIKDNFADVWKHAEKELEVPSAERKGKWNFIGDQMYECTECGVCYTQDQFYQMRVRITDTEFPKFCPNCGARMVSEDE